MKEHKLGHGQAVVGFESMEEMLAYMADAERQAIENAMPVQWDITWGSFVLRMVDKLAIWGQIFTEREFLADNTQPGKAPPEEALEELDSLRDAHQRGYRYGRWFSIVEPEGEYGSAHVSVLWEITRMDFEHARAGGWVLWPELANRVYTEMKEAVPNHEGNEE